MQKEKFISGMNGHIVLSPMERSGCDLDGDVVLIGDKTYYVHIFKNIVEEM